MQIKTKDLQRVISSLNTKPYIELEDLVKTLEAYNDFDEKTKFIASTIQGILRHNTVFKDQSLSIDLLKQLGPNHYFKEMTPKILFGRRQCHTTGIASFIRDNPNLSVMVVTVNASLVSHIKETFNEFEIDWNVPIFSISNPSSLRRIPEGTDIILVDEYPCENSTTYQTFLSLISNAVYTNTPLITLGTMF